MIFSRFSLLLLILSAIILSGCGSTQLFNSKETILYVGGKFGESVSYLEPIVKEKKEPELSEVYVLCYSYKQLNNYKKIFPCLDRMQKLIDAGNNIMWGADYSFASHFLRAQTNSELGNYEQAIEQAKRASILSVKSHPSLKIDALTTLGLSYALAGKKIQALETATKLEEVYTGYPYDFAALDKTRGMAAIQMSLGNFQKAVEIMSELYLITSATKTFFSLLDPMTSAWVFQELPYDFMKYKALFETQKYSQAKAGYDKLLNHPRIRDKGGIYWQLFADRGRIALHEKQYEQAVEFLKKSIDVIEQQRSSINSDASKMGFVGDKQEVYKNLISTLIQQRKFGDAFAYAERAKARALVDMLASKKQFSGGKQGGLQTTALLSKLDQSEADSMIQDERLTPQELSKTRGILVTQKQEILQAAPELASLVTVSEPSIQELKQLLAKDETLIEYYGLGDSLYAFLLSHKGVSAGRLNGKGLAESVMQYRKALIESDSEKHQALGERLYQRLMAPFAKVIKNKNITIVPHGILHYLPFNALHTGNEFIIDKYNVRLLPSASVMKFLKSDRKGQKGSLLALGNPDLGNAQYDLPGAQIEAVAIAKKIKGAKVLVRGNATESAVKQNGAGFRYLHLASHGTFDTEKPLSSALLLSKDASNDGRLTVGELYDLKLNTDLVTLSACETALGKIANGDDVVGFTRGFLYAGASSIVSSLWKVDDNATSLLMQEFYSNLQSTNKRDALRAAQLKLKAGKYSHPNYWAAFQLTGSVN
jgi:CHAT domain-containing protein